MLILEKDPLSRAICILWALSFPFLSCHIIQKLDFILFYVGDRQSLPRMKTSLRVLTVTYSHFQHLKAVG